LIFFNSTKSIFIHQNFFLFLCLHQKVQVFLFLSDRNGRELAKIQQPTLTNFSVILRYNKDVAKKKHERNK